MAPDSANPPRPQATLSYVPDGAKRLSLREGALLARYHLRLLDRWLFALLALALLAGALAAIIEARSATGVSNAIGLSLFALEPGVALFAGLFGSALIANDPLLETLLATRRGALAPAVWRAALSFGWLILCCAACQVCLALAGLRQANVGAPLTWLAPAAASGMLGLFGSLLARNAALGATLAAAPLAGSLFLYNALATLPAARPFLLTYSYSAYAAGAELDPTAWLANRLALLGVALALAGCNLWLLRREERLLGSAP